VVVGAFFNAVVVTTPEPEEGGWVVAVPVAVDEGFADASATTSSR
jgi:hypothetical protein